MSTVLAQSLRPGLTLAERYRLVRPIGRGGMGSVWEVLHARLGRQFALKVMSENLMDDGQALVRFRREADLVASLRHPNIIEIVDLVDLDNGIPCIVMEYLEGEDLSERIKRVGALDWPTVAMVGEQILSALSVAHGQGIVHRDLKPKNIFIARNPTGRDYSKLLDFGLSKSLSLDSLTVSSTSGIGTPAYMAPEQADERLGKAGPRSDVWSMGIVLFEMATGKLPFVGETAMATLYQICHGEPPSMREACPGAPDGLVTAIEGALKRNPEERWPSVDAFREELSSAFGPLAEGAHSGRRLESSQPLPAGKRQKVRDTSALTDTMLDVGSPDSDASSAAPTTAPDASSTPAEVTATGLIAAQPRGWSKIAGLLAGAGGLVAVGVLIFGGGDSGTGTDSAAPPTVDRQASQPEPTASEAAPAVEVATEPAATPASDQRDAATPSEASAATPEASAATAPPAATEEAPAARPAEPAPARKTRRSRRRARKKAARKARKDKPGSTTTTRERGKPLDPF